MASHYDKSKNCRVGTMDEDQFYSESGKRSGTYFKALMAAWVKKGGMLKWGAGGVGLRGSAGGKEIGICFLAPAYATKKDRIELSLTQLGKQIGSDACDALKAALQKAAGDQMKGASMVSIVEPGTLAAAKQKAVTSALGMML